MKPPTSNSSRSLSHSFLVTLFFTLHFSILSHFWLVSFPLRVLGFAYSFVSIFLCCIDSSNLVPNDIAHNPNTSCTKLRPHHFGRLSSLYRVLQRALYSLLPVLRGGTVVFTVVFKHHGLTVGTVVWTNTKAQA